MNTRNYNNGSLSFFSLSFLHFVFSIASMSKNNYMGPLYSIPHTNKKLGLRKYKNRQILRVTGQKRAKKPSLREPCKTTRAAKRGQNQLCAPRTETAYTPRPVEVPLFESHYISTFHRV